MILQRNIIYLLVLICSVSLWGLLSPWPTLVNVSSGLLSGAVIGILTSVTQYYKIREEYFANLLVLLKDFYKVFGEISFTEYGTETGNGNQWTKESGS